MADPFLEKFRNHFRSLRVDEAGARFLVAYSGGLDSTALLHLMARVLPADGGALGVGHLNHGLREQAAADQAFAEATARALNLPFFTAGRDVAALARERRQGLEEAGRRARYAFLREAAEAFEADFVLTAHQADDQAETILMNLIKGAGAGGLAGIHPRRPLETSPNAPGRAVELLRPLLPFRRAELQAWLLERGLPWVEDDSNQDRRYLRNAVRHDLLPRLLNLNPRLVEALTRTSAIIRTEEDFWQNHLARLHSEAVTEDGPTRLRLDRRVLESLHPAERRRLIYRALLHIQTARLRRPPSTETPSPATTGSEPLTFAGVETVLEMLRQPRHPGLDLPGGLRAEVTRDALLLSPASRLAARESGQNEPSEAG